MAAAGAAGSSLQRAGELSAQQYGTFATALVTFSQFHTYTQAVTTQRKSEMRRRQLSRSCSEKKTGDLSSAWKKSISCTYFVPFLCPRENAALSVSSLERNGGDDETRTRDLCRDRSSRYFPSGPLLCRNRPGCQQIGPKIRSRACGLGFRKVPHVYERFL